MPRGEAPPAWGSTIQSVPRTGYVASASPSGPHRIAYREWGSPDAARSIVCVHGLTGCARDFDVIAVDLAEAGFRVLCPDVAGRGDSDWLTDSRNYGLRQYVADMRALLTQTETPEVDWLGTSMGGVIGMALAAADDAPIRRLVLNDIGPLVPEAALKRLATHLGTDPVFERLDDAEAFLRMTRAPFGRLTDDQWRSMAERTTRPTGDGHYRLHYDPALSIRFRETADRDTDVWALWDRIECPVLVLRGEESDLLLAETAAEMERRGPCATVIEIAGCGHNPPLLDRAQIEPILSWLGRSARH